jgi:hypothetical protein
MQHRRIVTLLLLAFMPALALFGCSSPGELPAEKLSAADIDEIQVVLAMGNPEYGADSKIIREKDEIEEIVDAFVGATIGVKVAKEDEAVSDTSKYFFYSEGSLIEEFYFNGNDSERIWHDSAWHYISYPGQSPYELFRSSGAEIIIVDENFEEMERPDS